MVKLMKNKKVFILNLINIISLIIEFVICLIIAIINKDALFIYKDFCICLALSGIINFIFLLIKEIKILSYDSKKYTPILYVFHTFLGVLLYYVSILTGDAFNNLIILFWILLVLSIIVPIIVFYILNYFYSKKNKNNKPKFVVNK